MFLVRCVVASISYIIIIVVIIAAWRAGRSQWPIQKIVLQLDSLGYRVVLFRVILRSAVLVELRLVTDGHRAMASNKCIAVRKVATWDRAGARVGECEACARCTVADPGFLQGGAAAGAFGVPQAPSCPLSLRPLRKFRGS